MCTPPQGCPHDLRVDTARTPHRLAPQICLPPQTGNLGSSLLGLTSVLDRQRGWVSSHLAFSQPPGSPSRAHISLAGLSKPLMCWSPLDPRRLTPGNGNPTRRPLVKGFHIPDWLQALPEL